MTTTTTQPITLPLAHARGVNIYKLYYCNHYVLTASSGHPQRQNRGTGDRLNSRGQPPNPSRTFPGSKLPTRKSSTSWNSNNQLSSGRSSITQPLNTSNRSTPGRLSNSQNSTGDLNQKSAGQAHNQKSTRQALNGRNQTSNGQYSTGQPPQSFSRQRNDLQSQHSSGLRHQHNIPSPYPQPSEVIQLVSSTKGIEERIKRVEEQNFSIKECLDSVKDLLEKHLQQSFKIKGGVYEVNRYSVRLESHDNDIIFVTFRLRWKLSVQNYSVLTWGEKYYSQKSKWIIYMGKIIVHLLWLLYY